MIENAAYMMYSTLCFVVIAEPSIFLLISYGAALPECLMSFRLRAEVWISKAVDTVAGRLQPTECKAKLKCSVGWPEINKFALPARI